MNIGHSSLLPYDECAYQTRIQTSVDPMIYRLDTNSIWNKNQCYTGFGPRPSYMGNGVSTIAGHPVATSQKLIDIDSVLSNRNVVISKCKSGNLNPINVTKLSFIILLFLIISVIYIIKQFYIINPYYAKLQSLFIIWLFIALYFNFYIIKYN